MTSLAEAHAELEWRACRGPVDGSTEELAEAFAYFCATYWKIKHPSRGRIAFELYDDQLTAVKAWLDHRYTVILKARQIGYSTLVAAFAFWLTFFWGDRLVVMLSRTEREAAKLLAKSKYGYKALPVWLKVRGPDSVSDHQLKMSFSNESSIESLPSGNDPARGESVFLVVIDELAFLPNSEEAWASIEPIADVGGRVIALSTARGEGNLFHTLWVGSQTGANDFYGVFFPWSSNGRDQAWYEAKKRTLPDWQLHQEYPSNPDEAFIRSGNPVFDVDALRRMPTSDPVRGWLRVETKRKSAFERVENGSLAIWSRPREGGAYVIGADVAEGLAHGDFSSAHVIEARQMRVVAHWHGHIDPDLFGELLAELGWFYNRALVGVEVNNHGLTTVKALRRYGYPSVYRQRRLASRHAQATDVDGWRTTAQSKPLAIDELNIVLRCEEGETPALHLPCERTLAELRTFTRDDNGKMSGSPHDDRVMSLAIANQMLKYVWLPEYRPPIPVPEFSDRWFFQGSTSRMGERVPLGSHNVRS